VAEDKRRAADDRLALTAVIVGALIAFIGRRQPIVLGTGAALGLAGVLLALRGERPISARAWLRAALTVSIVAIVVAVGVERYQEWIVGQWFAEGTTTAATAGELRRMSSTAVLLRITALASSLGMLLGALVGRMR
jgi:hypothetical protein